MTDDSYDVGYGKPPKASQFKKGQSGNPSGRPKKMKSEKALFEEVLAQEHTLQGPNGPTVITTLGAIVRRVTKGALDGKPAATKVFFARLDAHGIGREDEAENLTEADAQVLEQYLELFRASTKGSADD